VSKAVYGLNSINTTLYVVQGRDLGGTGEDRPPQKVRWRGRRCFYPPNI